MGTCDLYEDGVSAESGDGVRAEGLRGGRDLPDAGGGGHLQGPGKQQHTTRPTHGAARLWEKKSQSKLEPDR